MTHLKLEHFRVIGGAINFLKEPYERMFHTVSYKQKNKFLSKGGGDEENHYVGNGFSDDACIYWRMLAILG